jgi:hypothetical protein
LAELILFLIFHEPRNSIKKIKRRVCCIDNGNTPKFTDCVYTFISFVIFK